MNLRRFFRLKAPCANCPFLKAGGIELNSGRLEGTLNRTCCETIISPSIATKLRA